MNLSQEQLDVLKTRNFYFYNKSENNKFPYVEGCIGRNQPEFYNVSSIEKLIEEIKQFGKPLEDKDAIQFKTVEHECYTISQDRVRFLDLRKNKQTGDLEVESPIRKTFQPRLRLILEETEDYYNYVSRYNGDLGDGSQYLERAYKSFKSAERACVVILETHKKKLIEQVGYVDILMEQYQQ